MGNYVVNFCEKYLAAQIPIYGGFARSGKFSPPLEKCVGHSLELLDIV